MGGAPSDDNAHEEQGARERPAASLSFPVDAIIFSDARRAPAPAPAPAPRAAESPTTPPARPAPASAQSVAVERAQMRPPPGTQAPPSSRRPPTARPFHRPPPPPRDFAAARRDDDPQTGAAPVKTAETVRAALRGAAAPAPAEAHVGVAMSAAAPAAAAPAATAQAAAAPIAPAPAESAPASRVVAPRLGGAEDAAASAPALAAPVSAPPPAPPVVPLSAPIEDAPPPAESDAPKKAKPAFRRSGKSLGAMITRPRRPAPDPQAPASASDISAKDRRLWRFRVGPVEIRIPRMSRYVVVGAAMVVPVWMMAITYLQVTPKSYESTWSVILPGDGIITNLNLDQLGQASSSSRSPFASKDYNPKSNYKTIAESKGVRAAAAEMMGVSFEDFAKPRIKLVPQTSIMEFTVTARSPEDAQKRANVFIAAFESHLNRLRLDDIDNRARATLQNVEEQKSRLSETRRDVLAQQKRGEFVNTAQFDNLAVRLQTLRAQSDETQAMLNRKRAELDALQASLGVTPELAADALHLKADRSFQTLAAVYTDSEVELAKLRGVYGERHPQVVAARQRAEGHRVAVEELARTLIGNWDSDTRRIIDLTLSPERSALFAQAVSLRTEIAGLDSELIDLAAQIEHSRDDIKQLADDAAALEDVQRDHQVAEAVFTSTLAKLDLSKVDPYAAYPLAQILDPPSYSKKAVSPNKTIAIAGAGGATVLILLAQLAAWHRHKLLLRRRKKKSPIGPSA